MREAQVIYSETLENVNEDAKNLSELSPEMLSLISRIQSFPTGALTLQQFKALQILNLAKRPLSMSELAHELSLNQSSASEIAKRLVGSGHVERERLSEDERVVRVRLSKKGKLVAKQADARLYRYFQQVCETLDAETRRKFVESHLIILDILRALTAKTSGE